MARSGEDSKIIHQNAFKLQAHVQRMLPNGASLISASWQRIS